MAKVNKAMQEVGLGDQGAVPCVKQEENYLQCKPYLIAFVCHDFKALVKIAVFSLDQHRIVIIPQ